MYKITTSTFKIIKVYLIMNFFIKFCENKDKTRLYHLFTMMTGIIMPSRLKSCREISSIISGSPDNSNLNNSIRSHGIFFEDIFNQAKIYTLKWMLSRAKTMTEIKISIDDTFLNKISKQKSLDLVYYNGKQRHHGIQIVFLHIQVGKYHCLYGFRVYDPNGDKTKIELAKELIDEISKHLMNYKNIYVLADSWYADGKLMKYVIHELNWVWIGAIKSNRKLNDKSVTTRFHFIENTLYRDIELNRRIYKVIGLKGKLNNFEDEGLFITTKKNHKNRPLSWRFYYCSDPRMTVHDALSIYNQRWRIEQDFWTLKEHLGIQDFRFHTKSSFYSFLNIALLSYLWLHHIKNLKSERINAKKVKYGVCEELSEMRKIIKDFFDLNGEDSIGILLNEFMSERLQIERLE
jgi:hypothetical protein